MASLAPFKWFSDPLACTGPRANNMGVGHVVVVGECKWLRPRYPTGKESTSPASILFLRFTPQKLQDASCRNFDTTHFIFFVPRKISNFTRSFFYKHEAQFSFLVRRVFILYILFSLTYKLAFTPLFVGFNQNNYMDSLLPKIVYSHNSGSPPQDSAPVFFCAQSFEVYFFDYFFLLLGVASGGERGFASPLPRWN